MTWSITQLVRFGGYCEMMRGVPAVFFPGDILVVMAAEADGVLECQLADANGRSILSVSDTIFVEELA